MNPTSSHALPVAERRFGLAVRLAILCVVFFADKVALNQFVDFDRAQLAHGLGAWVRIAQHFGFRFIVALATALAVFATVRGGAQLASAVAGVRSAKIRLGWMLAHLLLILCLMPLSSLLYPIGVRPLPLATVVALWIALAGAAVLCAFLAMAPVVIWRTMARAIGRSWLYAAIAALLGAGAMQLSEQLWGPAAGLTFDFVQRILSPVIPTLIADPATRTLSTDRFAIRIADVCSGLEGVGLILAFTAAWLIYFRREYIFPRALILIPVGLVAIFALNVLRIAALMLIGYAGYPDVAQYGFHSEAGWIAFNIVACGLAFLSRRSAWLNRTAQVATAPVAVDNPTAVYLMPFLAILAAGLISHAMSGRFETFYPLRLIAGLAAIWMYRRRLAAIAWRCSWRGPAVGIAVFLVWIIAAHFFLRSAGVPDALAALSPAMRALWIASRVTAAIVTVPIAEELAFRGYLLRRLVAGDFESVPYSTVGGFALVSTAVVFGLAHGALWLPGIIAGLGYGLIVMRRGSLGEAVVAHATTNVLVAVAVLGAGMWQLW